MLHGPPPRSQPVTERGSGVREEEVGLEEEGVREK